MRVINYKIRLYNEWFCSKLDYYHIHSFIYSVDESGKFNPKSLFIYAKYNAYDIKRYFICG